MTSVPQERALVQRLASLLAEISELTMEAEGLKAELRVYPPGDYDAGQGAVFRVAPTRKFDALRALTLVPEELRSRCWTPVIDAAKVREFLAPALVESCMVENGKARVTLL